jgi:hypothetical protein
VGGAELGVQDGFQSGGWAGGLGCLGEHERREKKQQEDSLEGHDEFLFVAWIRLVSFGKG